MNEEGGTEHMSEKSRRMLEEAELARRKTARIRGEAAKKGYAVETRIRDATARVNAAKEQRRMELEAQRELNAAKREHRRARAELRKEQLRPLTKTVKGVAKGFANIIDAPFKAMRSKPKKPGEPGILKKTNAALTRYARRIPSDANMENFILGGLKPTNRPSHPAKSDPAKDIFGPPPKGLF
jgi:hypothetical protein